MQDGDGLNIRDEFEWNILLIGEGDLSFSSCLCKSLKYWLKKKKYEELIRQDREKFKFKDENKLFSVDWINKYMGTGNQILNYPINLYCTTLITRKEMISLYKNSQKILNYLETSKNQLKIVVKHQVNAFELSQFDHHMFDRICWNNPYTDDGSIKSNIILLEKFLKNASQFLKPGGLIILTLFNDHIKLWNFKELINNNKFEIVGWLDNVSFVSGYNMRRNKSSKILNNNKNNQKHKCRFEFFSVISLKYIA